MKPAIGSKKKGPEFFSEPCGPSWARTSDPLIMSQVL